jgi:glycosyltransferase involved in cell wall biosynthesis
MAVYRPHPRYFTEAVESVLAQTFGDFEFVIVEDPSEASAADLLTAWQDPRIRHIANLRRTSLLQQRNRGLAEARGELVAIVDADDVWERDKLEKEVAFLRAHTDTEVVGSHIRIIDDEGRDCGYRTYPLDHEGIARAMRRSCPVSHSSVVYRREAVVAAGGYQFPERGEDYELWCRLVRRGARFATYPEPLVRYRLHGAQQKAHGLRDLLRAMIYIKEMYWGNDRTLGDRCHRWLEKAALWLPPGLLMKLVRWILYSDDLPDGTRTRAPALASSPSCQAACVRQEPIERNALFTA